MIMLATILLASVVKMNDVTLFFRDGDRLQNVVTNVPSSARAKAMLVEQYGTLSGWFERTALLDEHAVDGRHTISNLADCKTVDLSQYWVSSQLNNPYYSTNRVVTLRFQKFPHYIIYSDIDSGGGGSALLNSVQYEGSTQLDRCYPDGTGWPHSTEWRSRLYDCATLTEWLTAWPTFNPCETDGVWKVNGDVGYPGFRGERFRQRGGLRQSEENALENWRHPVTCLSLLKDEIGDVAYSLTNRTGRIDRNGLTALEWALGLVNILYVERSDIFPPTRMYDIMYAGSRDSHAEPVVQWSYDTATGEVVMTPLALSWSDTIHESTTTNRTATAKAIVSVSHGTSESLSFNSSMAQVPISMPVAQIYTMAEALVSSNAVRWTVYYEQDTRTSFSLRFVDDARQYLFAVSYPLVDLSGHSQQFISVVANQSADVITYEPVFDNWTVAGIPTDFLSRNNFVADVDCAFLPAFYAATNDVPARIMASDFGNYLNLAFPGDSEVLYTSRTANVPSGLAAGLRTACRDELDYYRQHLDGWMLLQIGGNVADRNTMLPILHDGSYESAVLPRVQEEVRRAPAQFSDSIGWATYDGTTGLLTIAPDESSQGTSYSGPSGSLVITTISAGENGSISNNLPRAEAAAAAIPLSWSDGWPQSGEMSTVDVEARCLMRWKNLYYIGDE